MTIAHVTNSLDLGAQLNDLLNKIIDAVNAGTSGVITFNTRNGAVTLTQADVVAANGGAAGTATAAAGAATLNAASGAVTSEALVAATSYVLTLTDSAILAGSIVLVNVIESTGAAAPIVHSVAVTAGQVVITVSMAALTGTLLFNFIVAN